MTEDDAFQVDTYLDRLLAGHETLPAPVDELASLDAELAATASALQGALVRFHPSFGFEERLAARLHAAARQLPGPQEPTGRLIAFPGVPAGSIGDRSADRRSRTLLVGGAIASGVIASGVSLAGAMLLAWRRARAEHHWERLG